MTRNNLTKNEKKVLYGLINYPDLNNRELADKIKVKLSTLTSIKRRLSDKNFYHSLTVPMLNCLGCELLAVIHTRFNPVIPLEERVKTTKSTIEVFEEIFFSVGEQEKGFSLSLSTDYSNISRINEIRTETFGNLGLLEEETPDEVIFPFETSKIIKFFDFGEIIREVFNIEDKNNDNKYKYLNNIYNVDLSDKEKKVYRAVVENPGFTNSDIGDIVGLSRHTVSRMKKNFSKQGLLKRIVLPNLEKLGFEILAFYHIKFNPHTHPGEKDIDFLNSPSTVFFATKKFEAVIISIHPTYQDYKEDKMKKIRFLRENDFISYTPVVSKYRVDRMVVIKNFDFVPLVEKVLNI
ncbi:MAG: helix-turn-helix domain-containing protein [Candidatus Thermoplasmatota archaeon]